MTALLKTESIVRKDVPIDKLVSQGVNPNKMSDAEFNMLFDNMGKVGFIDPVFVRPLDDGTYRIIGGHHRVEAAKLHGFEKVPCTIITDSAFDADFEKFQVVRMNMIRGKLDPKKFLSLYDGLNQKYADDVMAEAFGFVDENDFKKLINQMSKSLPAEDQKAFKEAAAEIKTIDGLSKLLNQMFAKHGSSLPYGYMFVDFGGKSSVWVRMASLDNARFQKVVDKCVDSKRGVDSLFRLFLQSVAEDKMQGLFESLKCFPEVQVTKGVVPMETVV